MSSGIEFTYTGVSVVDSLLNAITEASSVHHDSTLWDDEVEHHYLDGSTPAQWIEGKAQELATEILWSRKEIDNLKIALKCLKGELKSSDGDGDKYTEPTYLHSRILADLKNVDEGAYKLVLGMYDEDKVSITAKESLDCAFYWSDTPQGWDYWFNIHTRLEAYRKSTEWGVSDDGNW